MNNIFLILFILIIQGCNSSGGGGGKNILTSSNSSQSSKENKTTTQSPSTSSTSSESVTSSSSTETTPSEESPISDFARSVSRTECSAEFDASCITESTSRENDELKNALLVLSEDSRPEIRAIVEGKKFIMRVSDSLENDYFEILHHHPLIQNPNKIININSEELNEKDRVSKHGKHLVTPKKGFEFLENVLPNYVVFHEEINTEKLKEDGYQEIWVDNKIENCEENEINWSERVSNAVILEKAKAQFNNLKNPLTPACNLTVAVRSFCPHGSKIALNNPKELKKVIIQVKSGLYKEVGDIYLCSGTIIKNYNNETVTFTNYVDPQESADQKWISINPDQNIWAMDWTKSTIQQVFHISKDDNIIANSSHYDSSTIAPDRIEALNKINNLPFNESLDDRFRWVDISIDASKQEEISIVSSLYEKESQVPDSSALCTLNSSLPTRPLWNVTDQLTTLPTQTTYHCISPANCSYKTSDPEIIKTQTDSRECCPWYDPISKDGKCATNYRYMTEYQVSKNYFHPEICSKLPGSPEKCIVLRLTNSEDPNNLNLKVPLNKNHLFRAPINAKLDIFQKEITLAGFEVKFNTQSYVFVLYGNPTNDTKIESQYIIDGIEISNPGTIFLSDGFRSQIKNSSFPHSSTSIYLLNSKPELKISNNIFSNSHSRTIHFAGEKISHVDKFNEFNEAPREEYSLVQWNNFFQSGGIETIHSSKISINHNSWIESGGQPLFRSFGPTHNLLIADNYFLNNRHSPIYFNPYLGFGFHLRSIEIKENQIINTPTVESKIANSLLFFENPNFSVFGSQCKNIFIHKNMFLDLGPTIQGLVIPTYCQDTTIEKNLFSHSEKAKRSSVILSGFINNLSNFTFKENIVLGTLEIPVNSFDTNGRSSFGFGDSKDKCLAHYKAFNDYCSTANATNYPFFGSNEDCVKNALSLKEKYCTEELNKSLLSSLGTLSHEHFNFQKNYAGKIHVKDVYGEFKKSNFIKIEPDSSIPELLELRAQPVEKGLFEYSKSSDLPNYWNEQ